MPSTGALFFLVSVHRANCDFSEDKMDRDHSHRIWCSSSYFFVHSPSLQGKVDEGVKYL